LWGIWNPKLWPFLVLATNEELFHKKEYCVSVECKNGPRIIGGMFGLGEISNPSSSTPHFLTEQAILFLNASSGISLLIKMLSPPQVWMPSYLCDSMLRAVDQDITAIRFYEMNYDLTVPKLGWIQAVRPEDLVVLVDFFGFPLDKGCAIRAKKQGAWILEDACQALLSGEVGQFSDFVLYSPRKFLGVPDGGVLILNHKIEFDSIKLKSPPVDWWLTAFSAAVLRREFDLHGGSRHWSKLFQETETEFPIGPYAMSELSEMLLKHTFDFSTIAQRRIENYQLLADSLSNLALFPTLPNKVVPLGFPIRVKKRDSVRESLFDNEIYPPVHWPIQGIVPKRYKDSHRLSAKIMTLPCDQRYNIRDMERIAQVVRGALRM